MKPEEQVAHSFLAGTYPDFPIIYEPDGNVAPDFEVAGSIAVEVRRLNENYISDEGEAIGLEQDQISLQRKLEAACAQIAKIGTKQFCLYADIVGSRPLDLSWVSKKTLSDIYSQATEDAFVTEHSGIRLEWNSRVSQAISDAVVLYGYNDLDAGGWTGEVYSVNIQAVIAEKWAKCAKNVQRSDDEWWLVLVDFIFPGSSYLSRYDFAPDLKGFTQVIVIDQGAGELHRYTA